MSDIDPRLQAFVDIFNICYPDWRVGTKRCRSLKPAHVNYDASLTSHWAECGPMNAGKVFYRLNTEWWDSATTAEQLGLLLHEVSHVKHQNHHPEFWREVVRNFKNVEQNLEKVKSTFDTELELFDVIEFILSDPSNERVDNRIETVVERRQKLADDLGYTNSLNPFSEMKMKIGDGDNDSRMSYVVANAIKTDSFTVNELATYLRSPQRSGITYKNNAFIISPPTVRVADEKYIVTEGRKRAALILQGILPYSDRSTIPVIHR